MIFINRVILIGRLVQDTELNITPNGVEVLQNTIAVQRNFKNQEGNYEADFINFVAYRNQAKLIADYFQKGDRIGLEGRWQKRSYLNNQNQRIYVDELIVENIEFLQERRNQEQGQKTAEPFANTTPQYDVNDDDLPF